MTRVLDSLILGASAAGLATAACLKDSGQTFEILEATDVVGQAWRHHYERLHLHTPKSLSSLPGLAMPSEWPRYPGRDQVVDYLERYCAHHRLEPRFGQKVIRLERRDDKWFATTVEDEWCAQRGHRDRSQPPAGSPDLAGARLLSRASHALQRVSQQGPMEGSAGPCRRVR